MEFEVFKGQDKSELSMIEVARAILEARGRDKEMYFSDLVDEIQAYLGRSNSDIRDALPNFYTELNVDGSFIPLGENKWGLRSWYAIDEIDEEVITLEDEDEDGESTRKRKRVNAFLDSDEEDDNADYADEDEDEGLDRGASEYDDENPDDEKDEVESYDAELNEIIPDDEIDEDVELGEEDEDYSDEDIDGD